MGGVVNILVRQVKGDDLAVAGVNANVQLAPSAKRGALSCHVFQTTIRRPRAISVPYCRRSGEVRPFQSARGCKQAIHTLAGSASYDREPAGRSPAFS